MARCLNLYAITSMSLFLDDVDDTAVFRCIISSGDSGAKVFGKRSMLHVEFLESASAYCTCDVTRVY